jgi:glycosyltransferase involved in cell wall biosynthesis
MRVAILSHNAQAGDAIGNQVAEKLTFFLERGADVCVFVETIKRIHPAVRPHVRCVTEPAPHGEAWDFLSSADLVIVEYGHAYELLGFLPLLSGARPRIVFDYHGITPAELWEGHNREGIEKGACQRGLVWCADAAVTHSEFTAHELEQPTRFPVDWSHVLGHAVDAERLRRERQSLPHSLRQELQIGDADLALYVGRVAPNKRLPILIEALSLLRNAGLNTHLLIVGDNSDVYRNESDRCLHRADELAVRDRVHMLGAVSDARLSEAYRSADLFVMPSVHEGFCIPVVEAMAAGVPVVVADAGALPETLASAGLTFAPDDAADLARQMKRVLGNRGQKTEDQEQNAEDRGQRGPTARVAIVAFRYGQDFVGGAERSLRTIVDVLTENDCHVEVFTTCTNAESEWCNALPEGTAQLGTVPIHRFRIDAHDRLQHYEVVRAILEKEGTVEEAVEREYLKHSIHSSRLVTELGRRASEFDAILVGPYLYGLTFDVAQAFPDKTILLPCFHDEPFARLKLWRGVYRNVASIWYHSPEEKRFAETRLGLSHPYARCVGTFLEAAACGNPDEGRRSVGDQRRYLVYCGRYSRQKNVPLLIDHAKRYSAMHPERFVFVFVGQGEVPIPSEEWARDLGFVPETVKRNLLAGAAAVVQLSRHESLSLVALEAWLQGTPVIAHAECAVLAGQVRRSGGGRAVRDFESFSAVLDELWHDPMGWRDKGASGRTYATSGYGDRERFAREIMKGLQSLRIPLCEQMRRRGLERAAEFDRLNWRKQFGEFVEHLLHAPRRPSRQSLRIEPRELRRETTPGMGTCFIPIRLFNDGTHALVAEGPARAVVRSEVLDSDGESSHTAILHTDLPGIVMPGANVTAAVRVAVPARPGGYHVRFSVSAMSPSHASVSEDAIPTKDLLVVPAEQVQLIVTDKESVTPRTISSGLLETVQGAIAEADRQQRLPDDYLDVTEGLFARWKRKIKQKLLGNFKHAYVDVLSRQQSRFNGHILAAVQELAECIAVVDHLTRMRTEFEDGRLDRLREGIQRSLESGEANEVVMAFRELLDQLAESRKQGRDLEERVSALERLVLNPKEPVGRANHEVR